MKAGSPVWKASSMKAAAPSSLSRYRAASSGRLSTVIFYFLRQAFRLKQTGDIRHGSEQPHGTIREGEKSLARVEPAGVVILGIDDDGEGGDLAAEGAVERVGEQEAAVT